MRVVAQNTVQFMSDARRATTGTDIAELSIPERSTAFNLVQAPFAACGDIGMYFLQVCGWSQERDNNEAPIETSLSRDEIISAARPNVPFAVRVSVDGSGVNAPWIIGIGGGIEMQVVGQSLSCDLLVEAGAVLTLPGGGAITGRNGVQVDGVVSASVRMGTVGPHVAPRSRITMFQFLDASAFDETFVRFIPRGAFNVQVIFGPADDGTTGVPGVSFARSYPVALTANPPQILGAGLVPLNQIVRVPDGAVAILLQPDPEFDCIATITFDLVF